MLISTLDQKHESYDAEHWDEVEALCVGGKRFKRHLPKFLPQNGMEPGGRYELRKREAHYTSYMGSIINLYTSWLFSAQMIPKAIKRGTKTAFDTVDAVYSDFQEDVGNEVTLFDFMKERFRQAMKTSRSHWIIERPTDEGVPPETMQEYEDRGLNRVSLRDLHPADLFDWERDASGALLWALVHTKYCARTDPQAPRKHITEEWRIYYADHVDTYKVTYEKGKRPPPDTNLAATSAVHGFTRVPIVCIDVPEELCVGEMTYDPQLEHFRLSNGMSWAIRQTCYAMPVFHCDDHERQLMGNGYYLQVGKDDKVAFLSPTTAPFDILQRNIDCKRDEIYRIVHQMAQGLDNNAETVGRSAESKEIDAAATRLLLNEYGTYVRRATEETFEIISEALGHNDYEWSVDGFTGYDTATVSSLLANAKAAKSLGIPSETFEKEIATKAALAMVPEVDHRVKDAIRAEINNYKFTVSEVMVDEAKIELMTSKADKNEADAKVANATAGNLSKNQVA